MSRSVPALIPLEHADDWLAFIGGMPHGFGHRPEYSRAAATTSGLATALWAWRGPRGRACCPVSMRDAPGGGLEILTPLGFAGFALEGETPELADVWMQDWRDRGAIAAYVQLSPMSPPGAWRERLPALAASMQAGPDCWCWDLAPDPEQLLAGMAQKHRQLLRKWQREEVVVAWDQDELLERFNALYGEFLARTPIGQAYRYAPAAIAAIARAPGAFFVGARGAGGEVEAVTLFLSAGEGAESFLNAATVAGRRHSRGLYWHGALRLRESGVRVLNLGGGVSADDALSEFKQRLGAQRRPTLVIKQVLDPVRYSDCCARAGVVEDRAGYFPPWRRPPAG